MFWNNLSGTHRRIFGALLFFPMVLAFVSSHQAAQWLFLPIAGLMVWEFASMTRLAVPLRLAILTDFALFALPAPLFAHLELVAGTSLAPVVLALALLVLLFVWMATRDALATWFGVALISCVLAVRGILGTDSGHLVLLAVAAIVAGCDVAAYFVGRQVGGPRLAPSISPNKTRSGALGGLAGALLIAVLFATVASVSIVEAVIGGIGIAVLAQAGDLLESMLKRRMGVKDSGWLIPGHGGFLDRFDGYLLTLPAVYLYILAG